MPFDPTREGLTGTVVIAIVVLVAIAVGILLTATMAGFFESGGSELVETDTTNTIDVDSEANQVTAYDSTGYAVAFDHGLAEIDVPTDGGAGQRPHSAAVWARLDSDAATYDDYHVANLGNGEASIQYRDGKWWVGYNTSGESATVTTNATTPTERTMVGYRANATHLSIVRNGQIVNATTFDSGALDVPSARTWWGQQDELRVWGTGLTAAEYAALHDDPIGPLDQGNVTLRMMLDEGSGSTTLVLPDGGDATLQGATSWDSDGLEPTAFQAGTDYIFSTGQIEIVDGSRMDQLGVAYVEYENSIAQRIGFAATAFDIMLLAVIMLVISTALFYVRQLQQR